MRGTTYFSDRVFFLKKKLLLYFVTGSEAILSWVRPRLWVPIASPNSSNSCIERKRSNNCTPKLHQGMQNYSMKYHHRLCYLTVNFGYHWMKAYKIIITFLLNKNLRLQEMLMSGSRTTNENSGLSNQVTQKGSNIQSWDEHAANMFSHATI